MMLPFAVEEGPILVPTRVFGSGRESILLFLLDTGATRTMINEHHAVFLGYDPAAAPERVEMTTASSIEHAPLITVDRLEALGHIRTSFLILSHTLPNKADVDGVLGLDFFRGRKLTLDFRIGLLTLE
jgi:hypothetical protein